MTDDEIPTAQEVRDLMRGANWKVMLLAAALVIVIVPTVWFSASSRAASRDSFNATSVGLADNARTACISSRRNEQLDAMGDSIAALGLAQIAGLIADDQPEALRQIAAFQEADARRIRVSESLDPAVIDLPEDDGGCGPPVLSLDDLDAKE